MRRKINSKQLRLLKKHLMRESEEHRQDVAAKRQEPFRLRRKKQETQVKEEEEVEVEEETEEEVEIEEPVATEKHAAVPTYNVVKDKLNTVRSGKSLDDAEIGAQLETYFNELSEAEKLALFAYLEAFAEIISGGEDAKKVDEPSQSPYGIKMTLKRTGGETETLVAKDKVVRVAAAQDTPIVVGESARGKKELKKMLLGNN